MNAAPMVAGPVVMPEPGPVIRSEPPQAARKETGTRDMRTILFMTTSRR